MRRHLCVLRASQRTAQDIAPGMHGLHHGVFDYIGEHIDVV